MEIKIIYEDSDVLVVDKPAGLIVFSESVRPGRSGSDLGQTPIDTLIYLLVKKYPKLGDVGSPPRYGIVHRLDKDTSGVLLVAKSDEALIFLQKQFSAAAKALADKKNREPIEKTLEKRYITLVEGDMKEGPKGYPATIHTLIGRAPGDKRKQKAYPLNEEKTGRREAITKYKVLQKFKNYSLLEVQIKTGRRHQIRCHLAYIHHPIAGDKMYEFKNQPTPEGLIRQFLHASYLKIKLSNGETKEFKSELPEDLKNILKKLENE